MSGTKIVKEVDAADFLFETGTALIKSGAPYITVRMQELGVAVFMVLEPYVGDVEKILGSAFDLAITAYKQKEEEEEDESE